MSNDEDQILIRYPEGVVSITWALYVHGRGFSMRTLGLPSTDDKAFMSWIEATGQGCEHSRAGIWIFQGYFPDKNPNLIYQHVTFDMHTVSQLLERPALIRLMASEEYERAPLVPVDPVTKDGLASVEEYNNWVEASLGLSDRKDFSALSDVSFDGFEDMLRQAANNNNNKGDE